MTDKTGSKWNVSARNSHPGTRSYLVPNLVVFVRIALAFVVVALYALPFYFCLINYASLVGCAPTLAVRGVYFPAWLVSAVVGLVVAYAIVWWAGRRSERALTQSGVLFCSLTLTIAMLNWWIFFSGF